jgi:hypothetical protein
MEAIADVVVDVLAPFIGPVMADTCVRGTAIALGKSVEALSSDDLPALLANVRRYLAPVTSPQLIDSIVAEVEWRIE